MLVDSVISLCVSISVLHCPSNASMEHVSDRGRPVLIYKWLMTILAIVGAHNSSISLNIYC